MFASRSQQILCVFSTTVLGFWSCANRHCDKITIPDIRYVSLNINLKELYLRRYWTDFKSFGCFENFGTFSETYADQIHATMDFEVRLSGKLIVAVVNFR